MSNYIEYDDSTLNKLHQIHLEILNEIKKICDKNNLTYFLVGGTLLGAVRHAGFIPWDDDIDIGMPRSDYDKFIKIAQESLDANYFLDCFETNKDYYLPFAKVKKNNTIFDEKVSHHLNNHKGIYVDIFPFENVDKNDWRLKIHAFLALSIAEAVTYKKKVKNLKMTRHAFLTFCLSFFSHQFLMNWQKRETTYCKNNDSLYLCVIGTGYGYKKELNLRSDILPVQEIVFSKNKYNGMQNNDAYLKGLYGDYMKLPPKEKRRI